MIEQHDERPKGTGFPNVLEAKRIIPLSTVFIVANDFADYIIYQPNWKGEVYLKRLDVHFKGAHFRKVRNALKTILK